MTDERKKKVTEQIKNLQIYLDHVPDEDSKDMLEVNQILAVQSDKGKNPTSEWIIDNSTTHHMIDNYKIFYDYKLTAGNERVFVADGTKVSFVGCRSISLVNKYFVHDVFHVPIFY